MAVACSAAAAAAAAAARGPSCINHRTEAAWGPTSAARGASCINHRAEAAAAAEEKLLRVWSSRDQPKLAQKCSNMREYNNGINTVLWECIPLLYSRCYNYKVDI